MSQKSHITAADELLKDLDEARSDLGKRQKISMFFIAAGGVTVSLLLLAIPESLFFLPAWFKSLWWALTTIALTGLVVRSSTRYATGSLTRFYRDFCNTTGLNEIKHALDLHLEKKDHDSRFYQLAIERNLQDLNLGSWRNRLEEYTRNQKPYRDYSRHLRLFVTAFLLLVTSSLWISEPVVRSAQFWRSIEQPNPFQYSVQPGNVTLEHGSTFTPQIGFSDVQPGQVTLAIKTDIEDRFRYRPMVSDENGLYRASPVEMTNDGSYFIIMDRFESDPFAINVQFRPRFESLRASVTPPEYTGLPDSDIIYPFAQLSLYQGSVVTLQGEPNKPVSRFAVQFPDSVSEMQPTSPESNTVAYSFVATQSDTVRFAMRDEQGLENRNPFQFYLRVRTDRYPVVTIRQPEAVVEMANPDALDLRYVADDDFGLTEARLDWQLTRAFTESPREGEFLLPVPEAGEISAFQWDLAEFDLRPRDLLTFRISVVDNDGWNGFKRSWSSEITVRIPSVTAWLEGLNEQEEETGNRLDDISSRFSEMQRQYEEFREQMSRTENPGWEEEELLEEVSERQQEIESATRDLSEQFESIRSEIENSNSISDETKSAYRELQQIMEELDSPELRQALEELREAMQELSQEALENAMQNFEFNERVYQQRLERTIELFRTLQMNSDLDRLATQYDNMADRMEEIATGEKEESQELEQQRSVREDMDSVEDQLEMLDSHAPDNSRERIRQLQQESLSELEQLKQELDSLISTPGQPAGRQNSEAENDRLSESSESENGDSPSSTEPESEESRRERQESVSGQLQQRASLLRNARQQMSGEQIQLNILALQQALYNLIELSESQEELTIETGRTESRSQSYVDLTREQNRINNLFSQVSDSLTGIASRVPALSSEFSRRKLEVERLLTRSQQQMAERSQPSSVTASRESLSGINELTSMIASLLEQLSAQQSAGGAGMMSIQQMVEQIQGMSQNQQQLNREIEQMINDMQGDRLSRDQTERLEQIARQQNEIRRQLEGLQRSGALGQGDRILSEMQRTLEEMEDAINDMRGGLASPDLVNRQQNILSRMLNAEDALQQRGEQENEYEGETADPSLRAVPPDMTLEELQQEIRSRLNSPDFTRFSDEYQRLIERYFEELRQFEGGSVP